MRSSVSGLVLVLLVLVVVLSTSNSSEAAVSCSGVAQDLQPCMSYLSKGSGKPPVECCNGAKKLAAAASSSADKKTACNCIKSAAKGLTIKSDLAQSLPSNCGISIPFSISPNTDCTKIN